MSENAETPIVASTGTPDVPKTITDAERRKVSLRDLVMRQTGYSLEEATDKLDEHKNDILAIVREYMGVQDEVVQPETTSNQILYREMRGLMDNAARAHRQKKEMEETKNNTKK